MTVGIAVETTDVSSATRNVATNRASVTSRRSDTRPRYPVSISGCGADLAVRRVELRQPDADQRAGTFARAARPDAPMVLLDDVAANEQPEAHARDLQLLGIRRATEG